MLLPSLAFLSIKLSKVIQKSYNARKLESVGGVVSSCQSKRVLRDGAKRGGHRGKYPAGEKSCIKIYVKRCFSRVPDASRPRARAKICFIRDNPATSAVLRRRYDIGLARHSQIRSRLQGATVASRPSPCLPASSDDVLAGQAGDFIRPADLRKV